MKDKYNIEFTPKELLFLKVLSNASGETLFNMINGVDNSKGMYTAVEVSRLSYELYKKTEFGEFYSPKTESTFKPLKNRIYITNLISELNNIFIENVAIITRFNIPFFQIADIEIGELILTDILKYLLNLNDFSYSEDRLKVVLIRDGLVIIRLFGIGEIYRMEKGYTINLIQRMLNYLREYNKEN